MDLVYFILTAYGLTQILVYGKIFEVIRPSKRFCKGFFHCPMCIGFWVGTFLFGINEWTVLFTFEYSLANLFILSWLASGTSYILTVIIADNGLQLGAKGKNE